MLCWKSLGEADLIAIPNCSFVDGSGLKIISTKVNDPSISFL